jgi:AcrR family transcriptional regulator
MSSKFENNKKYQQILATGRDLFWKHGFKRVSIEEVCLKAEVSKMTFYRFFPNKIELAKAVFDQVVNEGLQKFKDILHEDSTSSEKIRKIMLMKMDGTHNISKEFLQDFYNDRELGLKEYIDEKTRQSWSEILNDFKQAQEKGWFRSDMKPEFLFYFSQKMGELLIDENLLKLYHTPQELILELTNFFAYGISPRDPII